MPPNTPPFPLSTRARRTPVQPIGYLMAQAVDNPNLISLAAGLVDQETLPAQEAGGLLRCLLDEAAGASAKAPLQYGTTQGLAPLRQELVRHLAALDGIRPEDLHVTADDVIVTTGSQQLLFLLTDVLVDPGDIVLTAWPDYFVYNGILESAGAEVRAVDTDEHGMIPEALERVLAELARAGHLPRVKIVYVCDYHQNPTGLTLSAERRPEILRLIQRYSSDHRILLLEDSAYRELTFAGTAPPFIKRWDTDNQFVALCCTFSKPFAPGVKTGYALLPRDLMTPVLLQKGNHDFGSTNLVQHLLLAAMRRGLYAQHVAELRGLYAAKSRVMLEALAQHLGSFRGGAISWTHPRGGLYVWLTLPSDLDTGRESPLFRRAIAEGVLYVPGEFCYGPDRTRTTPRHAMRLSYGLASTEQIREGVRRLAAAIRATSEGSVPGPSGGRD